MNHHEPCFATSRFRTGGFTTLSRPLKLHSYSVSRAISSNSSAALSVRGSWCTECLGQLWRFSTMATIIPNKQILSKESSQRTRDGMVMGDRKWQEYVHVKHGNMKHSHPGVVRSLSPIFHCWITMLWTLQIYSDYLRLNRTSLRSMVHSLKWYEWFIIYSMCLTFA